MRVRLACSLAATAVVTALALQPAAAATGSTAPLERAEGSPAVAIPGSFAAGFATPVVLAQKGAVVTFHNADLAPHNVIASDAFVPRKAARKTKWCSGYQAGRCPLFWSATIGMGDNTPVLGLQRIKPGKQYAFFCSLHPNMRGVLVAL